MVLTISSSVSSAHSSTMSVRWTITSSATVSLNSKTFSIISFSSRSMAPCSSPMSTIMRMPSSETSSSSALGSTPIRRSTPLVQMVSRAMKGLMTTERIRITPPAMRAT